MRSLATRNPESPELIPNRSATNLELSCENSYQAVSGDQYRNLIMCGFERVTRTDEECGVRCTRSPNWWPRLVPSVVPGHLYPAIQVVRALATAVWVADSPYESSSEAPVEETGILAGSGLRVRRSSRVPHERGLGASRHQLRTVVPSSRPIRNVAASASAPPTTTRTIGRKIGLSPR
jgi:hypothetical protein